jgi:hypothetical protein
MYNDAHLPDDEAWTNMTADLRETKESRNTFGKENSYVFWLLLHSSLIDFSRRQLKRRLAEVESEKEECVCVLLRNSRPKPTTPILGGVHYYERMDLSRSSLGYMFFIFYHLHASCNYICTQLTCI